MDIINIMKNIKNKNNSDSNNKTMLAVYFDSEDDIRLEKKIRFVAKFIFKISRGCTSLGLFKKTDTYSLSSFIEEVEKIGIVKKIYTIGSKPFIMKYDEKELFEKYNTTNISLAYEKLLLCIIKDILRDNGYEVKEYIFNILFLKFLDIVEEDDIEKEEEHLEDLLNRIYIKRITDVAR